MNPSMQAFCRILSDVSNDVIPLQNDMNHGRHIENLGSKADQICSSVIAKILCSYEAQENVRP